MLSNATVTNYEVARLTGLSREQFILARTIQALESDYGHEIVSKKSRISYWDVWKLQGYNEIDQERFGKSWDKLSQESKRALTRLTRKAR